MNRKKCECCLAKKATTEKQIRRRKNVTSDPLHKFKLCDFCSELSEYNVWQGIITHGEYIRQKINKDTRHPLCEIRSVSTCSIQNKIVKVFSQKGLEHKLCQGCYDDLEKSRSNVKQIQKELGEE